MYAVLTLIRSSFGIRFGEKQNHKLHKYLWCTLFWTVCFLHLFWNM